MILTELSKTKPREFWKKIKSQCKGQTQTSDSLNLPDVHEHFKNLYNSNDASPVNGNDVCDVQDEYLDAEITPKEIKDAVFKQNNNKSAGLDNIEAEIYKHAFPYIEHFLYLLFNRIFIKGEYPDIFGEGVIVPIFKGGNADDPNNYRGITLINILSKIYSQILLNRLTKWSTENDKMNENQFGFQKNKSTIDCIFILHAMIAKTLNEKHKLYCCFIDFEKCFDTISRGHLFNKLMAENVSSRFIKAIRSMYNSVKAAVRYKSQVSDFFPSNIGLKQGDPSSSILFLFFVNDITDSITNSIDGLCTIDDIKLYILLFADEAVIFAKTPNALQSMINDMEHYCKLWDLKVNVNKSKIMIFERGRHTSFNFTYSNIKLDVVSSFKYLGVTLHKNGNWHRTQKHIAQ